MWVDLQRHAAHATMTVTRRSTPQTATMPLLGATTDPSRDTALRIADA